jgi:uroporphyrinogen decarboxylase
MMTPRERWQALLTRQSYDRMPLSYRATTEFTDKLLAHLGFSAFSQVEERLHLDPVVTVGPRYVGPPLEEDSDVFGVRYQYTEYSGGRYHDPIYHPLACYETICQIEAEYTWPDPDWWDYSGIPAQIEGKTDCIIRDGGGYEEFAKYKALRGVQQAYLDLIEKPDLVAYCMGKLTDLRYEDAARIYQQIPGKVLWTWVAEDVAGQEGLFMSLGHIRELLLPHMKRMVDLVHEAGAFAFFHSDGGPRQVLPDMVEIGMDVLEPVQWRCAGMEREGLKRDFGDDLIFMGGMDNQQTLPFGSPEQVRQEVHDNISILGAGGGYILGPCHNIQVITPPENVVVMYDTAYECGVM